MPATEYPLPHKERCRTTQLQGEWNTALLDQVGERKLAMAIHTTDNDIDAAGAYIPAGLEQTGEHVFVSSATIL